MSKYTLISLLMLAVAFNVARFKNPEFMGEEAKAADTSGDETTLEGVAVKIIDGDSFLVDETKVRLWGVDAPEYRKKGFEAAREGVRDRIGGRFIECTVLDVDRYGRQVAHCRFGAEKQDLGASLLQAGLVREYCHYSNNFYGYCSRGEKRE